MVYKLEEKLKGIIIGSKDYKEKDKISTLFTIEKGLVNVVFKGVKSPNAKLKVAKEIFCFGEYLITNKNNYSIVIGCDMIDSFFNLSQDIDKYMEACAILCIVKDICKYGQQDVALFLELLTALKVLAYENAPKKSVIVKFLIRIFETMGYKLNLNKCAVCGNDFFGKRYFCLDTGEICCVGCKEINTIEISAESHTILRIISNTDYNKLTSLKFKFIDCFNLMKFNYKLRFNKEVQNF
ncbi:MAG: DNA repair protein RecO [Clostridia bacterium]|nr:DNA repair protein RecO [Clostridia bacterium]